jgi:hypothetical protein
MQNERTFLYVKPGGTAEVNSFCPCKKLQGQKLFFISQNRAIKNNSLKDRLLNKYLNLPIISKYIKRKKSTANKQ